MIGLFVELGLMRAKRRSY